MPLPMLTRDEVIRRVTAFLDAHDPALSVSPDTGTGIYIQLAGDLYQAQEVNAEFIVTSLFPQTAETDELDLHAEARIGPGARKAATTTDEIDDALEVLGAEGSVAAAGSTLVHVDGTRYQLTTGVTIGSSGIGQGGCKSLSTGRACNKIAGETLAFEEPAAGIEAEATLVADLEGALDQEGNAELANRVLDAYRNPHAGGRFSDYRRWAEELAKVARAWVYGCSSAAPDGRAGYGIVDVAITSPGSGTERVPTQDTLDDAKEKIDASRPSAMGALRMLRPVLVTVDFDLRINPTPGYEFDWSSEDEFTVSAWESAHVDGPKLTWNAALPDGVVAGARIFLKGQMAVVESVGTDYTILDRVLSGSLIGEVIYPAGPCTEAAQVAVRAHVDALGPAKGTAFDRLQPSWEDSVKLSKLFKELLSVTGVNDATIVTPAANVVPTDAGSGETISMLTWGTIVVRPMEA